MEFESQIDISTTSIKQVNLFFLKIGFWFLIKSF